MSGVVAAVIPTQHVTERGLFVNLAQPPVLRGPGAPIAIKIEGHAVTVHPPAGYSIVQVREGSGVNASVTLAPNGGPGENIVVRFDAPDFVREGAIVGTHDGAPVHDTRFGLLWRSPTGLEVLVSGAGETARLAVIDALEVTG